MNKKNYNYGKIENDELVYAPYYLIIGKLRFVNASQARYLSQGWKKIKEYIPDGLTEEEIEAGYAYKTIYTEDEQYIYVHYKKVLIEE